MWYKEEGRWRGIEEENRTKRGVDSLDSGSYNESWEGNIMERRKYRIPICT